jgi:mono/diheme cytochrome c family protein
VSLYAFLLLAHSWVRWGVVVLVLWVFGRSVEGARSARPWLRTDERAHVALIAFVDLQLLLGVWLYVSQSAIVRAFLADPAQGMKITALRFFGLEHAVTMLLAVLVLHVARVRSKKKEGGERHRTVAAWMGGGIALVIAGIPWPFLPHGRPLLREPPALAAAPEGCPPSYAERCVACHGARGHGDGFAASSLVPHPRDFSDAAWGATRDDAQIAAVIREGGAKYDRSAAMPAHADLGASEVDGLVRCVRSFAVGAR